MSTYIGFASMIIVIGVVWGLYFLGKKIDPNNTNMLESLLKSTKDNLQMQVANSYEINIGPNHVGFYIDSTNQIVAFSIIQGINNKSLIKKISYKDILNCQIVENKSIIKEGGVKRAIAGGLIAGSVGAIIGANTAKSQEIIESLQLKIKTKNILDPIFSISLIYSPISRKDISYTRSINFADKVCSVLDIIIDQNKSQII